jgi:hypothetical protein
MKLKSRYRRVPAGAAVIAAAISFATTFLHITGRVELGDGVAARAVEMFLVRPLDRLEQYSLADRFGGLNDGFGRKTVPCPLPSPSTAVLVTFGQSNAANNGPTRNVGSLGVINFNFHDGQCYRAEDPLLGTDGEGGSLWTLLGNRLVDGGDFEQVVIVPLAVGGSSINRWSDTRDLGARLEFGVRAAVEAGLTPTHILVVQGEADVHAAAAYARLRPSEFVRIGPRNDRYSMRAGSYMSHFDAILDQLEVWGIDAPTYVALKTRCGETEISDGAVNPVALAQRQLPQVSPQIRLGPDIDGLPSWAFQPDLCHMSDSGLEAVAETWAGMIERDGVP